MYGRLDGYTNTTIAQGSVLKGAPHWSSVFSVEILTNFIFEFVFYK